MSYKRTTRCSYCGETGHNRRTCPEITKLAKEWEKSDDPYYKERAERLKKQRKGRAKRCSHCGETGHTIRTCDKHKAQVNTIAQSWLDARHFIKDRMNQHNFGIGSLVKMKKTRWCNNTAEIIATTELGMVTDIQHHKITNRALTNNTYFRSHTPVIYVYMTGEKAGQRFYGRLPLCIVDNGHEENDYYGKDQYTRHKHDYILVSSTEAMTPDDFLEWDKIYKGAYEHSRGRK